MKALKYFFIAIALIVAILVGVGIYVFSNLNQIIKEAVETVGPTVTKTEVLLEKVDVKVTDGRGQLNNFTIANPEGFSDANLFSLDNLVLQFNPKSVLDGDVIVIEEITVEGLKILAEQKGFNTNVQAMLDNLSSEGASESSSSETSSEGSDVKLIIEKLKFAENDIQFLSENLGEYTLGLPSFELNNLGSKENGLTPEEMGVAILKPVLKQAEDAVKDKLEGLTREKLEEELEKQKAKVEEKVEELKDDAESKLKDKLKDELGEDTDLKELEEKAKSIKNLFN